MNSELTKALADELYRAYCNHAAIDTLISQRYPELTADEAYQVQRYNAQRAAQLGHRAVGYKIGLTAEELMASMEVDEPDYGRLYSGMELAENGAAPFDRMFEPKVEGEIAFVLGADLPRQASAGDVLAATGWVQAAFEFPETRLAGWRNRIADTVSDNSSAGHFMRSSAQRASDGMDFAAEELTLYKNGAVLARGRADVILGNPLNSVAWLSNKLYDQYGRGLKAGDIVLSGALCGAHPASPGDRFEAEFSTLGRLSVTFA